MIIFPIIVLMSAWGFVCKYPYSTGLSGEMYEWWLTAWTIVAFTAIECLPIPIGFWCLKNNVNLIFD